MFRQNHLGQQPYESFPFRKTKLEDPNFFCSDKTLASTSETSKKATSIVEQKPELKMIKIINIIKVSI
jgi:hypothetical protein